MMTSRVTYLGELRTKCEHERSGANFITDAPVDNQGKGEAFSPTDTVATALASCMLTIIGIKGRDHDLRLEGTYAQVTKTMASDPRRISGIGIDIHFQAVLNENDRLVLERAARTCPVFYSIHPDIVVDLNFHYD